MKIGEKIGEKNPRIVELFEIEFGNDFIHRQLILIRIKLARILL